MFNKFKIGVIGLGYVGLPVAVIFSKKYKVFGFDIDKKRINQLNKFEDKTLEIDKDVLRKNLSNNLKLTNKIKDLKDCNIYIITVPTPINTKNQPDLSPLLNATKIVSKILNKGDIIIYESTVFPGCTEEVCVPLIVNESGLKFNKEFFCGYSPERINPGDKKHNINKIVKITSGSNNKTSNLVDMLYSSVIKAGTYKAASIKVAEAAKVIENAQRDINIAFVNELAIIFKNLKIDTNDVLDAASTKWNFLNFRPGLVGGHCIGVDPYYLADKSIKSGYTPKIILAGRNLNNEMSRFITDQIFQLLKKNDLETNIKTLVLGVTFKENCPDFRNTKVISLINGLSEKTSVDIYDPWVDNKLFKKETGLKLSNSPYTKKYDVIVLAVSHKIFKKLKLDDLKKNSTSIVYDVKGFYNKKNISERL